VTARFDGGQGSMSSARRIHDSGRTFGGRRSSCRQFSLPHDHGLYVNGESDAYRCSGAATLSAHWPTLSTTQRLWNSFCGIHGGCSLEESARSGRVVVCTYWLSTVVRRLSNSRFSRRPRTQAKGKGSPGHVLCSPAKSADWADPPSGSPFAMPRGGS
jgi:hypothetical protein